MIHTSYEAQDRAGITAPALRRSGGMMATEQQDRIDARETDVILRLERPAPAARQRVEPIVGRVVREAPGAGARALGPVVREAPEPGARALGRVVREAPEPGARALGRVVREPGP